VDAVIGDRGQALVLAVLALGIAAVTIVGLRAAQDRVLGDAHDRRAGEAAVEAAGATVADALVDLAASLRDRGNARVIPTRVELEAVIADPLIVERSRRSANDLSAANRGGPVRDLVISIGARTIDISLWAGAHQQSASIETACCRR
jgi:hypothetical protein